MRQPTSTPSSPLLFLPLEPTPSSLHPFIATRAPAVCNVHVKPAHVGDMQAELRKARGIYENDSETIGWHVMQHEKEPTRFCSEQSPSF